jgi:hypothetical protein
MTAQHDKHHFPGRIYVQQPIDTIEKKLKAFDKKLKNRILRCPVNETVFVNVVNNSLNFIVWDLSSWSTSRLYEQKKQNKIKEYSLIEIYITFKGRTHSVICEYQGFFTTQSNHEVTFNEYKQFVRANSYVLKLGKILKIS